MKKLIISSLTGATLAFVLAAPSVAAQKQSAHQDEGVWPAETISGTISMVEPGQKVVVIKNDNVPFDMVVTRKTRIMAGNQSVRLDDLSKYQNKNVSVHFVPEGRGDIAQSIKING